MTTPLATAPQSATLSTARLILWPSVLTLLISVARLVAEQQGHVTTASGGRGLLLGITWCIFVFGAWLGWRLARSGQRPRVARPWLWALLALLAVAGTIVWQFRPFLAAERTEAVYQHLRNAVLVIVAVTAVAAAAMFAVWPRLAWTMLLYALPTRATVVALTWLAKQQGWDTHYTKFGPSGFEREMGDTMLSASVAQFGGWVPFTVVGGVFAGSVLASFVRRA
jgi:hypothetical protein